MIMYLIDEIISEYSKDRIQMKLLLAEEVEYEEIIEPPKQITQWKF